MSIKERAAGGGWPLPVALACQQFIPRGSALAIGGRTQCDLRLCQIWGEGLSNASVSSRHLSGEVAHSESLLNSSGLGSHLVLPSLSVSVHVFPQIYVPHNTKTTPERYPCKNKNCPWPLSLTFWPFPFSTNTLSAWDLPADWWDWVWSLLWGHLKIMWFSGTQKHPHTHNLHFQYGDEFFGLLGTNVILGVFNLTKMH